MKYHLLIHATVFLWLSFWLHPIDTVPSIRTSSPTQNDAVARCQDITVSLDSMGQVSISASDIDNGSTGQGNLTFTLSDTLFSCRDVGQNIVRLSLEDEQSFSQCTSQVSVQDTIAPTLGCQNITLELDPNGTAMLNTAQVNTTLFDACGISNLALSKTTFDCTDVGSSPVQVTLTAKDPNQNTSSCHVLVDIVDSSEPQAKCKQISVSLDAQGGAKITVADVNDNSSDNCGIAQITIDRDSFTCSDVSVFSKIVNLKVTDTSGNEDVCQAFVQVEDQLPPVANCLNPTVYLDQQGQYELQVSDLDGGSFDNCGIATIDMPPTTLNCGSIGSPVSVSLEITDLSNNKSSCTANVTVRDDLAPQAVCHPLTVHLDQQGLYTLNISEVEAGSSDNCGINAQSLSHIQFSCMDLGTPLLVDYIVTDPSMNADTCVASVMVKDNIKPTATCQPHTIYLDSNGQGNLQPLDVEAGSFDNCGINTQSLSHIQFTCADVGAPIPVEYVVMDASMNSDTCIASIVVKDSIAPTAICQSQTVYLDVNGQGSIQVSDVEAGSMDNCGIDTQTLSHTQFSCADVGAPFLLNYIITDHSMNADTCISSIMIKDTISPEAICQPHTVYLDNNGVANIQASDVEAGSTDNCGIRQINLPLPQFDSFAITI